MLNSSECESVCAQVQVDCNDNDLPCRYSDMAFTKNPEKYLKYTPQTLEETLEEFFDGGA